MTRRVLYTCSPLYGSFEVWEELFDDRKDIRGRMHDVTANDVVLFDGGTDVNPELYGETRSVFTEKPDRSRDTFERQAFRRAQGAGAACIGVCRGAQLLTVLSGGKLIQHVEGHNWNYHEITDGINKIKAAGDHHQMMFPFNIHHFMIAWSVGETKNLICEYGKELPDEREPEIVWIPDTRSLCVQPHPEWMEYKDDFPIYCRELVKKFIFGDKT